jgi:hypothetical protein
MPHKFPKFRFTTEMDVEHYYQWENAVGDANLDSHQSNADVYTIYAKHRDEMLIKLKKLKAQKKGGFTMIVSQMFLDWLKREKR